MGFFVKSFLRYFLRSFSFSLVPVGVEASFIRRSRISPERRLSFSASAGSTLPSRSFPL